MNSAPKSVVYVDDDEDIRQIASLALSLNDEFSVQTCSSGEAALELLPRVMPEMIILDVMMPGLDGPSTLARIRANERLAHIPVAFMTAKAQPHEVQHFMSLGVVGVIPKPFDPMNLAGQVVDLWRAATSPTAAHRQRQRKPGGAALRDPRTARLEGLLQRVLALDEQIDESAFDLDVFMQRVVDDAQRLTNATGAVIELVDGDAMTYRSASSSLREHVGFRIQRAGSLSGSCVEQARVLICDDSEVDPRVDREACRRVGVRSMICTPLLEGERAIGVLKVISDQPHAFDYDNDFLLTLLGSTLGNALARAR